MDFIKKHYEKVLLSIVLLGLAVAAALLPLKVSSIKEEIERNIPNPKPKELQSVDLTTNMMVIQRIQRPSAVNLANEHNLFNPVQWQKRPDGGMIKILTGNEVGPGALKVLKIVPLNLVIEFEGASAEGETIRYKFAITREADKNVSRRRKTSQTIAMGSKNDIFLLKDARGPKEAPTEVVLEMDNGNKTVVVSKDKPHIEVAGYMADLRYDPENKNFPGKRVDDPPLSFAGDAYNIVAITENEVVLSAKSTSKRTTVKWNAAP